MALSDLLYRTTDVLKWGAGLGRNLVAAEIDGNFWTLKEAIEAIELEPGNGIASIEQLPGTTTIVITLDDASQYSFSLPLASLSYTGAWQANHDYVAGNIFSQDDYLYFVRADFHSNSIFEPALGDGGGPFQQKLIPFNTKVKVAWFWPTKPGAGIGSSATMFAYLIDQPMHAKVGLPGARAELEVAPTEDCSWPLLKNATPVGSIDFVAGQKVGTFTFSAVVNFVGGDKFRAAAMVVDDDTAAGLMVNIPLTLGAST